MNSTWDRSKTEIERLTIRYQGSAEDARDTDTTILRLRMERLLDSVDVQPVGLPSGAVFIVRKLEGLVPLSLSALSHSSQPTWAESVHEQMATLYATASRPVNGAIVSSAASVLFADPGEMLACLTRDLLTGNAWQLWYWQQVLRNVPRPVSAALTTLWSRQAPFVPTVWGSLSRAEALTAVQLLSPSETNTVAYALHASFDLPSEMVTLLRSIGSLPASSPGAQPVNAQSPVKPRDSVLPGATLPGTTYQAHQSDAQTGQLPIVPPWRRWLQEAALPALRPQAQYLLGLGLTLYHAPAFARSTKFATQATSWLREQLIEPFPAKTQAMRAQKGTNAPFPPLHSEQSAHPERPGYTLSPGTSIKASSSSKSPNTSMPDNASEALAPSDATELLPPSNSPEKLARNSMSTPSTPTAGVIAGTPSPKEFVFGEAQSLPSDGSSTGLGGTLYLIHLLTWLKLPGGWDEEGAFSEGLSGWAIVEALARGLLGTALNSHIDDPLWNILALLDQREPGTPVGADMPRQTAFRLPAHWLLRYGSQEPTWIARIDDSRVLLFDKVAGYLVVDVPFAGCSPDEAVLAEVEAYRTRGIDVNWHYGETRSLLGLDANSIPYLSEHAAWWLERVLGFVCYLLVRLLGDDAIKSHTQNGAAPGMVPSSQGDGDERYAWRRSILPTLSSIVLCRAGQLIASRTHIDLYMSMEQMNLAIRRAGLDRDPGWSPDLGRIVLFHFD